MTHGPFPTPRDCAAGALHVERRSIAIPTYPAAAPEALPMFFERRVYQGSNGKVYPLPVVERIGDTAAERHWDAVVVENRWLQLVLLPELGGRIHRGYDKCAGYDFFYRQDVIKPALVGLAGPWASGGVEFNWPQHHRPSTWMPTDVAIEHEADGAVTVWMSEHEPMSRMKGMHGIRIRPDSCVIESRARIVNRTPHTRSFLWWANVAARVHDRYQSFFPPDVTWVADHACRATISYPMAKGHYYGVDYGAGTDLGWYKNIPVPTSYMVRDTRYGFFGGYDHAAGAGFVHVADRHIAPGKKQWTWGDHPFGHAWDRELTDAGGPYIELMAGVYTDNQPDFCYLAPYETRTFSQCWWPFQALGTLQQATRDLAVRLVVEDGRIDLGVAASRAFSGLRILLHQGDRTLVDVRCDVEPGRPWRPAATIHAAGPAHGLELRLIDEAGRLRLTYHPPRPPEQVVVPPPATEPPAPAAIARQEDLVLVGEHLEQYRHPTRNPEDWWQAALERDPGDIRANTMLAARWLRRGRVREAEPLLRRAIARLTTWHPNPVDGEAHYLLGLALDLQGRDDEAEAAYAKATWNAAQRGAASYRLACLASRHGDADQAIAYCDQALLASGGLVQARTLRAALRRRAGDEAAARRDIDAIMADDPCDHWAGHEQVLAGGDGAAFDERCRLDPQTLIDIAGDYADAGLYQEACWTLERIPPEWRDHLVWLALAHHQERGGDAAAAAISRTSARTAPEPALFPIRPHDEVALLAAGDDPWSAMMLGNLCYDRLRHEEALAHWRAAERLAPQDARVLRNLGLAFFNILHDGTAALALYERAFANASDDARLLFELDQLAKRQAVDPRQRLDRLLAHAALIDRRDDLTIETVALLNRLGRHDEARVRLAARRFHPWEGGEGKVMVQHVATHCALARQALLAGDGATALRWAADALADPERLGEAKHLHAALADIHWHLGLACRHLGRDAEAMEWFAKAAAATCDFSDMAVQHVSRMTGYQALALRRLGRDAEADAACDRLEAHARHLASTPAVIDYFATSLPDLLVFDDDPDARQRVQAAFLAAVAQVARGRTGEARDALEQVLRLDPSHQEAAALLADLPLFTHI